MISMRRIGIAFLALGGVLTATLLLLLTSALDRLEVQRRLRHDVVAARIFDEAERELGSLLHHELSRPSSAYDSDHTRVDRWASFVVGYVRLQPELALVAEPQLSPTRRARVRRAALTAASAPPAPPAPTTKTQSQGHPEPLEPMAPAEHVSSPNVLSRLNRSARVREREQRGRRGGFDAVQTDDETLVLLRKSDDATRREGVVVDLPALVALLQQWLITSQGLGEVASLSLASDDGEQPSREYGFVHTLGAPLESQQLWLDLSQLDDSDERGALIGLAALLIGAAFLGLGALYRMVAVQVAFAERRNNFVSAVSHELKTPLTAIRMYAEMLKEDMVADDATRREYYDILTAEGERLTRLINNVMEHAQLRRGQRPVHLIETDASGVVREVLEVMSPHMKKEGVRCDLTVDQDLPTARLDVDALKQVMFNVLDNALKYGRSGRQGHIELHCSARGRHVRLRVRDHGPGLPPQQLAHIFEPFFRGEDELTRRQTGTGLGMALVRDLVQRMHGSVHAVNRNPGLEVQVELPVGHA